MSEHNDIKPVSLGGRIRMVRGKLSQAEFGWYIGKHKDEVIQYEANADTPSLRILLQIAEMGDVTVDWLIYG